MIDILFLKKLETLLKRIRTLINITNDKGLSLPFSINISLVVFTRSTMGKGKPFLA